MHLSVKSDAGGRVEVAPGSSRRDDINGATTPDENHAGNGREKGRAPGCCKCFSSKSGHDSGAASLNRVSSRQKRGMCAITVLVVIALLLPTLVALSLLFNNSKHSWAARVSTIALPDGFAGWQTASGSADSSASDQLPRLTSVSANGKPAPPVCVCTPFLDMTIELFKETVASVLGQTFTNFEWIIMDDYSNITRPIDGFAQPLDRRVRIVHASRYLQFLRDQPHIEDQDHVGLGNVRRLCVHACEESWQPLPPPDTSPFPFIIFLDADDLLAPTAVEKFFWYLMTHECAHFVSSYVVGFGAQTYLWTKGFNPSVAYNKTNNAVSMTMHRVKSLKAVGHSSRREGLEDWDTWLHYANASFWGATIPEPLVYYRRRQTHADRWKAFTDASLSEFLAGIPSRYPRLMTESAWPSPPKATSTTWSLQLPRIMPLRFLGKDGPTTRMLLLIGNDEMLHSYQDFFQRIAALGWRITIVTTALPTRVLWGDSFKTFTEDAIALPTIMPPTSYLEAVHNIMLHRQVDVVWIANSLHAHAMLPFLVSNHPAVVFVDYVDKRAHSKVSQQGVKYATSSARVSVLLDHIFVPSDYERNWMTRTGASANKVSVNHIGIDVGEWARNVTVRETRRAEFGIPEDDVAVLVISVPGNQSFPLVLATVTTTSLRDAAPAATRLHFIIASDDPLPEALDNAISLIPKSLKTHVHRIRAITQSKMRDLIMASDILLLPPALDVPRILVEAMAAGVVPVGMDQGPMNEFVQDGTSGYLLRSADQHMSIQVTEYITILRSFAADSALLQQMSKAAQAAAKSSFSAERTAHELHTNLELLAAAHKTSSQYRENLASLPAAALVETYRWAVQALDGETVEHL